ncbi:MAG: RecQ family ATP-dependent DNA helicase [Planctomycetes bacterium]|nr:RecQ family ATP-dependent DNA helicase [Planctomycetota bacterium]MBL7042497.1 RecQ family ATP-dependent DNA helicase [Pirellulaceae bacterium]
MPSTAANDPERHLARFDLTSFRPGQQEVISAVLAGHDCMCVMPTGGGKSLCYQLPAIARQGLTLVVSPLIALMKDQVDALDELGIKATFVNSSLSAAEQRSRLANMAGECYDLVYIAPERLRNPHFLEAVRKTQVQLLAVDEAHCISEWGHDFRPDYSRLGRFRQRLGFPQTIALTATATPEVRKDVGELLLLRKPKVFVTGFARGNLRFEVQYPGDQREKDRLLLDFLRETPGSGIIYASTRKKCGELTELISSELKRTAGTYHAGLMPDERRRVQEAFMQDRIQIVAATNAFGMGIDKSDLRFVVHYNMPGSVEAYYQEAGRAGRDSEPSRCLLLFSYQDRFIQEFFIDNNYPSREIVAQVYDHLRSLDEDPIEITLEDLKERLALKIGTEGVGASERLLEKCGAIERMDSMENKASVRIDSNLPTLVDLLPKNARVRRKVLRQVEQEVGEMRYERVYFHPQKIAAMAGLERDVVTQRLRELDKLEAFDYVPAFRGRAIHMLTPDKPFAALEIDFAELERRRKAEYEKLDRVVRFARTRRCRQLEILDYFGDPSRTRCGVCDNCAVPSDASTDSPQQHSAVPVSGDVLQAVRMALSGVARTDGRFGKHILAKMLRGSKAAEIRKFRLDRLSTFGLLKRLKQSEVVGLIDALHEAQLVRSVDVDRHRPVIHLTELGGDVMRSKAELPETFVLPVELSVKLGAQVQAASPKAEGTDSHTSDAESLPPEDPLLFEALRQWRREKAQAAGCPAYRVLTNAALAQVAALKPNSRNQLLAIKGIGKATARTYGAELLNLTARHSGQQAVSRVCESDAPATAETQRDTAIESTGRTEVAKEMTESTASTAETRASATTVHELERQATKPNFYWTWRLLHDGYSAEQCEQIRGVGAEDLLDHALLALEHNLPVRAEWFLSEDELATLENAIGEKPPSRMRALLDQLPDDIRYEHVRLFVQCRQQATDG